MAYYLDTSAFIKLVLSESETDALLAWRRRSAAQLFSSDLLRTEALRAARRHGPLTLSLARRRLDAVALVPLTTDVCERAALLDPAVLRSLDAIHLATALSAVDDLDGVVTYDERLAGACGLHGVPVVAPA